MILRELRKIARPHWFDILFAIKRSTGMTLSELAENVNLKVIEVEPHCDELEQLGYLDTWRQPQEAGKAPEKLYRLTKRANAFFPNFKNELTTDILESVRDAYGSNAPEKLIFAYFANKVSYYQHHIQGESLLEKATSFAIIRSREGFLCVCESEDEPGSSVQLIEYHNPLKEIFIKYPSTRRMEDNMIENSLGCSLTRQDEEVSGLTRTFFNLYTLKELLPR